MLGQFIQAKNMLTLAAIAVLDLSNSFKMEKRPKAML